MRSVFYILLLPGLIFLATSVYGQTRFVPMMDISAQSENLSAGITKRYKEDVAHLSGENKKYTAEVYKQRYEFILQHVTNKDVLTSKEAQTYLDALASKIFASNPQINAGELRIVFSKEYYANAASMGEGTIMFNIGLFHRLDNESEVAFCLCHELAHYLLDHGNNNINRYINTIYSDDFQKKLKSIKKADYGQGAKFDELAKNLAFKTRRHSREYESAADSFAIELLKKTDYDVRESLSVLGMLDSADKDKYNFDLELEKRFDFPGYRFNKSWLESDDLVMTDNKSTKDQAEIDSLKTHPDCLQRIEQLRKRVNSYYKPSSKKSPVDEAKFRQLKTQFDYEIIEHSYQSDQVSLALYLALQMLHAYPDDVYLNTMVGKCMNQIYTKQKAHELNTIAGLPNTKEKDQYNLLLQFIQNLRLADIAELSYNFLKQKEAMFSSDTAFMAELRTSREHVGK
jgi:Zn-dependent protease with chaperone function